MAFANPTFNPVAIQMKARYVYGTAPINFYPPFRLDFNVNFIDPCENNVLTFTSGPQLTAL